MRPRVDPFEIQDTRDPSARGAEGSAAVPSRLRRWLLTIHLYGGLLCCWYLIILGYTSLAFNHPWLMPETKTPKVTWQRPITVPTEGDDLKQAELVRDRLELFGWPLPWNMGRDGSGNLQFEMARPGRTYWIRTDPAAGMATVETEGRGFASILRFLHGSSRGVPNSRWSRCWGLYTEITTWMTLVFVGSGLILWMQSQKQRRMAMVILLACLVSSLGLMGYVWWVG